LKRLFSLFLILSLLLFPSCGQEEALSKTVFSMDTAVTFTLYGEGAEEGIKLAEDRLFSLAEILDAEGTAVQSLSQTGETSDPVLYEVISRADALSRKTKGALDLTLYPVIQAWGFISRDYRIPSEAELDALRQRTGEKALSYSDGKIILPQGYELTLGAVAKGYTGEVLYNLLTSSGISNGTLSLGGNVVLIGDKFGKGWEVGVRDPEGGNALILSLSDCSVVTSGGYERYFEENGVTYHHILDPQTLSPVKSDLLSVTVVSRDGLMADALSTALFVMGREEAVAYYAAHGAADGFDLLLLGDDGRVYTTSFLADRITFKSKKWQNIEVIDS